MPSGFDDLRRNISVLKHKIINDSAKKIANKINRVEPSLDMRPGQVSADEKHVSVRISGQSEIAADRADEIKKATEDAIEDTLGSN